MEVFHGVDLTKRQIYSQVDGSNPKPIYLGKATKWEEDEKAQMDISINLISSSMVHAKCCNTTKECGTQ
jgi:hypothetical protein